MHRLSINNYKSMADGLTGVSLMGTVLFDSSTHVSWSDVESFVPCAYSANEQAKFD